MSPVTAGLTPPTLRNKAINLPTSINLSYRRFLLSCMQPFSLCLPASMALLPEDNMSSQHAAGVSPHVCSTLIKRGFDDSSHLCNARIEKQTGHWSYLSSHTSAVGLSWLLDFSEDLHNIVHLHLKNSSQIQEWFRNCSLNQTALALV